MDKPKLRSILRTSVVRKGLIAVEMVHPFQELAIERIDSKQVQIREKENAETPETNSKLVHNQMR